MYQNKLRIVLGAIAFLFIIILFNSTSFAQETEGLPPFKIVHLGDSYSAGNGARSEDGDRNYHSVSGCYRSPTNWGSQFAESLSDVFAVTYINRACSGGVAAHILARRDMDDTSFKKLDGSCPTPDFPDEEFFVDTSTLKCSRFIRPQIDAIDSSVDLVLITMGGNDLDFDSIVVNCFVLGKRSPDGCRTVINNANDELETLKSDLINKFADIRAKLSPDARIAYVSYPHLMLDVEYMLEEDEDVYDVRTELLALTVAGDEIQRAAVNEANSNAGEDYIVFYDGTKALFNGHEPHPSTSERNPR